MRRPHCHAPERAATAFGLLLILASPLAAQVPAAAPDAQRILLSDALQQINSSNPNLRASAAEVEATRARITIAGTRLNPGLSLTRDQLSGQPDGYSETTIALTHTLEVGGQRSRRQDAATLALSAAEARLAAERARLIFEVQRAYVTAAAAEARANAIGETTEIFRTVDQSGQMRFAAGDISAFSRQRLEVERARYETRLADAELDLLEAGRELGLRVAPQAVSGGAYALLAGEALETIPTGGVVSTLAEGLSLVGGRADVRAATLAVEAARARVALERSERVPDVTLTGGYKHQADGLHGPLLGVSIPIPVLDKNAGRVAEADALLTAAEAERSLAVLRAEADIRRTWENYTSIAARLDLLSEASLLASAAMLQTAQIAYGEGEMSLVELLDAAEAYDIAKETATRLRALLAIAHFDLLRAVGAMEVDEMPLPEDVR